MCNMKNWKITQSIHTSDLMCATDCPISKLSLVTCSSALWASPQTLQWWLQSFISNLLTVDLSWRTAKKLVSVLSPVTWPWAYFNQNPTLQRSNVSTKKQVLSKKITKKEMFIHPHPQHPQLQWSVKSDVCGLIQSTLWHQIVANQNMFPYWGSAGQGINPIFRNSAKKKKKVYLCKFLYTFSLSGFGSWW